METSTTAQQLNESEMDLSKQVFSIIDSKIQYTKFMIKEVVKGYIDLDTIQPAAAGTSFINNIYQTNASIFDKIEYYNKCLRRMLLLRNQLNYWNSKTIFELITDNKYLNYTEDNLVLLLHQTQHVTEPLAGRASDTH